MAYVLISGLMYGDTNKQIKARVSRKWDYCDLNDSAKIFHTDLVLLDEVGNSIHVQIYPPALISLRTLVEEGRVYYFDSFSVKNANRTYRPVANPLMITFTKWTTLEECIDVPEDFPTITFSLTPFEDVPSLVDKNSFYVDVMGVITEIGAVDTLRPKSRNTDTTKRTMQICDANNSTLPITLWGEIADAFNAEEVYTAGQTKPQIIVFVGTLVKNYKGIGLTLNGSSPCKWYLNLHMPETLELRESFSANFQPIKWVQAAAAGFNQDVPEEKTIAQILALNPHKHARARFMVKVSVKGITDNNSWWYNSCEVCYKTSKPYGSTYRCTSCFNIGMPVPRYKVVFIAADDTAQATFILFGRIAQRLIRKPVQTLIDQNPPDSDYAPLEIAALFNQNFTWNVSFTQDTIMRNQETLQVNSIISSGFEPHGLLAISTGSSEETLPILPAPSSSSLQLGPAASDTSTSSQIGSQVKQAAIRKDDPSTPTKHAIPSASDDTPTSKAKAVTTLKKSYVLSVSPKQPQCKLISSDAKATDQARSTAQDPQIASSAALSSSPTDYKAKAAEITADNAPSTSPLLPTQDIPHKRGGSTLSLPPAKKLLKGASQEKGNKIE